MAATRGGADPALVQVLREEPYRFDFFQAVRLLQRLQPDREPVGHEGHPAREVARFLARLSLAFPASALARLDPPEGTESPPSLTVNFFGLTGPLGALPYVYTELLQDRRRLGDTTLAAFLDLFNHRLISLFYRAWEKHHPVVGYERGEGDGFADHLFALIGLKGEPLRGRHVFPDTALLSYAGVFSRRHRPAVVLEGLLRDYFRLPITVEQFAGQWLRLGPDDRSVVGARGAHNALGVSLVLGARVWDEQGKIRLRVGPLSFDEFRAYLPDDPPQGLSFRTLTQMTRLFIDTEFDFDVQLVLKAAEVPDCRLSSKPGAGARLGRYAWLKSRPFTRDVDDAVFPSRA